MNLQIGILACDHVDPELRDIYGEYPEMFAALLKKHDASIEITVFDLVNGQLPTDLKACDAYVITGSRAGVYEDHAWIPSAIHLVKDLYAAKIPTIGICFGHQLIAKALGGRVEKAEDKGFALGVQTWQIRNTAEWMGELESKTLALNASHQDQVIEMPKGSELIAGSDFCPISAFQNGPMLAIQGHPEFDYKYTKLLFDKRKDLLNKENRVKTIESFKTEAKSDLVGSWMVNFIKSHI